MGDFLKVSAVADAFGVSPWAVRRWIRAGQLKARKHRVTGQVLVPVEELERRKAELVEWSPGRRVQVKNEDVAPVVPDQGDGAVLEVKPMDKDTPEEQAETTTNPTPKAPAAEAEVPKRKEQPRRQAKAERAPAAKKAPPPEPEPEADEEPEDELDRDLGFGRKKASGSQVDRGLWG